jgi:hypothetical protein
MILKKIDDLEIPFLSKIGLFHYFATDWFSIHTFKLKFKLQHKHNIHSICCNVAEILTSKLILSNGHCAFLLRMS